MQNKYHARLFSTIIAVLIGTLLLQATWFYFTRTLESCPKNFSVLDMLLRADDEVVLLSPYYTKPEFTGGGVVYAINLCGKVVHSWKTANPALSFAPIGDGRLIVGMTPTQKDPAGGKTGVIQEIDINGNVLWEYKDDSLHHDLDILPNGEIALLAHEETTEQFRNVVKGGFETKLSKTAMFADRIVIVGKDKQVHWSWSSWKHIDPNEHPLGPLTPRDDWSHGNSIKYTEKNPVTGTPAFLLSLRHLNSVFLIDKESGNIIWRAPSGMLNYQHDATFLSNGNILVFDNGLFRQQNRPHLSSVVLEINPKTDEVLWKFPENDAGFEKTMFSSSIMGGAQRLPNGNTLVTLSTSAKIVEITKTKEVVWEFQSPFKLRSNSLFSQGDLIFKARKYETDFVF